MFATLRKIRPRQAAGIAVVAVLAVALLASIAPRYAIALTVGASIAVVAVTLIWLRARLIAVSDQLLELQRSTVKPDDLVFTRQHLRASSRSNYVQLEALHNLYAMLPIDQSMPSTRYNCASSPDLLLFLISLIRERRPQTIVELGSGASTIWLALALRHYGLDSRLISVEHDEKYAQVTRSRLRNHELETYVDVRHAPLADVAVGGETYPWYSLTQLADVASCDLLLVDGPPGRVHKLARYPALPILSQYMAPGAKVVLDDYRRRAEQKIVDRWLTDVPGWTLTRVPLEKGAALFTREVGE